MENYTNKTVKPYLEDAASYPEINIKGKTKGYIIGLGVFGVKRQSMGIGHKNIPEYYFLFQKEDNPSYIARAIFDSESYGRGSGIPQSLLSLLQLAYSGGILVELNIVTVENQDFYQIRCLPKFN